MEVLSSLTLDNWIGIGGILVGSALSILLYHLQQQLSDKQKIEHRLLIEKEFGKKLSDIRYKKSNSKIQLYNAKLLNSAGFSRNKRSILWGLPYHAAEVYSANFDGLEFVVGVEKWNGNTYYKVGVIDYLRILNVRAEGDGSFNGMIFYVRPKFIQKDKYSIAYKCFRYYPIDGQVFGSTRKPLGILLKHSISKLGLRFRYIIYTKWKMLLEQKK
jgi:hypothetical protein